MFVKVMEKCNNNLEFYCLGIQPFVCVPKIKLHGLSYSGRRRSNTDHQLISSGPP